MAKKKKVQKQSIKNRQVAKANKRKQIKKKVAAAKAPQKQMSMAKVKKNLKALPGLAFESELVALSFDAEAIKTAQASSEITPEQIDFAADQGDFKAKFLEAIAAMDTRFGIERDANKQMMTQAMNYFMEQEDSPSCMNQLVVAMYFNSIQRLETGASFDFNGLDQALKDYDAANEAYFETRNAEMEQAKAAAPATPGELDVIDVPDEPLVASAFSGLLKQIETWAESAELNEDQSERMVDDLTALFDDYASEKEWSELSDVTPRKIGSFFSWFERNMNPTDEDMTLLKSSISTFFAGSLAQEVFGEQTCGTVLATV